MPKGKNSTQIGVIMPNDLRETLRLYAEAHHWSLSQAAALLIEKGLNEWVSQKGTSQNPQP